MMIKSFKELKEAKQLKVDRYQVREFDGPGAKFGVYDTKTKKFVQKGSKYIMVAACKDLNEKGKVSESSIIKYTLKERMSKKQEAIEDEPLKGKDVLYVFEDFDTGVDKNQKNLIKFANEVLKLNLDPDKDDLKIALEIQKLPGKQVEKLIRMCYGDEIANKFEEFLDTSLETLDTSKIKYIKESIEDGASIFELKFDCSNEDNFGIGDSMATPLANILTDVATKVANGKFDGSIMDINGNKIGSFGIGYEGVQSGLTESLKKDEEEEITNERYQLRKYFDNDGLFQGDWGIYDSQEKKFIEKGAKVIMRARKDAMNQNKEESIEDLMPYGVEKKTEERKYRALNKGDQFKNPQGVILTIIDVDTEHLLDGEPQVTYRFEDGSNTVKCYKQSSVNSMLNQNKYELQESLNENKEKDPIRENERMDTEDFVTLVSNLKKLELWDGKDDTFADAIRRYNNMLDVQKQLEREKHLKNENKLHEDQYENERRRGVPSTQRIAEQEYYDNIEWYKKHINDYLDITDFVNKNIAEIGEEYNLRDVKAEEVCKKVYMLAIESKDKKENLEESQVSDYTFNELDKVINDKGNDFKLQITGLDSKTNWLNIDKEDLTIMYQALQNKKRN